MQYLSLVFIYIDMAITEKNELWECLESLITDNLSVNKKFALKESYLFIH